MTRFRSPWLAVAPALAAWALLACWLVPSWPLNADEGFYLAASRAIGEGLLPYRDYAYTQTPLLPLLQAPFALCLPPSLVSIRLISLLWTSLAFVFCLLILARQSRAGWTAWAPLPLFLGLPSLGFLVIGKTYAPAQLLLLVSALPLLGEWKPLRGLVWLSLFAALAVGCRLTVAPAALVLYLGYVLLRCHGTSVLLVLAIPTLAFLCLLGPFVAMDPSRFLFFNWEFHHMGRLERHPVGFVGKLACFAPGAWTLGAFALPFTLRRPTGHGILLLACLAGVIVNALVAGIYAEYLAPFVLGTWLGALGVLAALGRPRLLLSGLVLSTLVALACLRVPETESALSDASQATAFLRDHTREGDQVLASMPEIPLGAGRRLYRGLLMGKFAVTADLPPDLATRYGYIHVSELVSCTRAGEPAAVVLSRFMSWNFRYSLPSLRGFGDIRSEWLAELHRNYRISYVNENYIVLLRRGAGEAPPGDPVPAL